MDNYVIVIGIIILAWLWTGYERWLDAEHSSEITWKYRVGYIIRWLATLIVVGIVCFALVFTVWHGG